MVELKSVKSRKWLIMLLAAGSVQAAVYQIDTAHSDVLFKVKHMGISTVTGKFEKFGGTFSVDPENIKATKGSANIDANSINTSNPKRDGHLKGDDFFDVEHFPSIKFVSKEVRDINIKDSTCTLLGDLTIRGNTKEISLHVKGGGVMKDGWGNERAAFTARGRINRLDFGIKWNKLVEAGGLVVASEVDLELNFEGMRKLESPAVTPAKTKESLSPAKTVK
jgi:polyisoprenoid-binding protein YceI